MEYITEYADEQNWEKQWQKEYKYGVFLIYPPEPHRSKITELRNRYAWSQSSQCDAHISLSVQIPRPVTADDIAEIQNKLKDIQTFMIAYGPIMDKPLHRGVALDIVPQDALKSLSEVVEATSVFATAIKRKYPYRAHMTIAEMLTWEQTYQIIDELKDLPLTGEFELAYLSYAVPDECFKFTERARITIGG